MQIKQGCSVETIDYSKSKALVILNVHKAQNRHVQKPSKKTRCVMSLNGIILRHDTDKFEHNIENKSETQIMAEYTSRPTSKRHLNFSPPLTGPNRDPCPLRDMRVSSRYWNCSPKMRDLTVLFVIFKLVLQGTDKRQRKRVSRLKTLHLSASFSFRSYSKRNITSLPKQ